MEKNPKKQKNPRTPKFKQEKYAPYMKIINEGGTTDKGMSARAIIAYVKDTTGVELTICLKNKRTVINKAITTLWKFDNGLSLVTKEEFEEAKNALSKEVSGIDFASGESKSVSSILDTEECTDEECQCNDPVLNKVTQDLAKEATRLGLSEDQYEKWLATADPDEIAFTKERDVNLKDLNKWELARHLCILNGTDYPGWLAILFTFRETIAELVIETYLASPDKYGEFSSIEA